MAELAQAKVVFDQGCPDCGERRADLPLPLPPIDDDFDWRARDYDSFRLFLMQELAHRFPERRQFKPADMEVVVAELLAAAFDRLSHAVDVVHQERFLDSARRPQSVRRLLQLIGFDASDLAPRGPTGDPMTGLELEAYWATHPAAMEAARVEGPRRIGEQLRMVTLADHDQTIGRHPLVASARARRLGGGAWPVVMVAVIPRRILLDPADPDTEIELDTPLPNPAADLGATLWADLLEFERKNEIAPLPPGRPLTLRQILRRYIDRYRQVGTEVLIETATPAPITFTLSIQAKAGYFRSELRQTLAQVFGPGVGGFFERGRYGFGRDVFASDLIEAAVAVEGVGVACVTRLRRRASGAPDMTAAGVIPIAPHEFAVCENDFRLLVHAGETG